MSAQVWADTGVCPYKDLAQDWGDARHGHRGWLKAIWFQEAGELHSPGRSSSEGASAPVCVSQKRARRS